jgi:hypothetical protein
VSEGAKALFSGGPADGKRTVLRECMLVVVMHAVTPGLTLRVATYVWHGLIEWIGNEPFYVYELDRM